MLSTAAMTAMWAGSTPGIWDDGHAGSVTDHDRARAPQMRGGARQAGRKVIDRMHISEILQPSAVRSFGQVTSKKRLFQELAEMAHSVYGLPASEVLDALQERESLGPTGVGQGVALPHARLHGLDKVVGLFVRLEKPLDFDAVDRQPVDLVFALLAPKSTGVDHLTALALVSRTLRDTDLRAKLRANDNAIALHAVLAAAQGIKAA